MSETIFKKVDYHLGGLMNDINLGRIGLPEIQRPFVWKNAEVRDLFDSMYKGYPIGYLLFWENGVVDEQRSIGTDEKQMAPQLVVVDGQQRLTSLYAVIKGVPVVRKNYEAEVIRISFNPLEEKFEVTDAAIERDKSYISDISKLWRDDSDLFAIVGEYLSELQSNRMISPDEDKKIKNSITKLKGLLTFPFTTLQLAPDISEEDVSDVFVRVNSKGAKLNQADFILTLMSVFWDEGRTALEEFCRDSRKPSKDEASPFNYFIDPSPDQLLRVSIGLGFKRARLRYVYSILRGKDLETEQFSDERRVEQFDLLRKAQEKTLDLQNWHDFMVCIHQAGFRSDKMISSANNLLFSYILYLIGQTEYKVDKFTARRMISQWFFMSAMSGRFTGSPETAMDFDLASLREISKPEEFVSWLGSVCDITLTNDFWEVNLPNELATSAPRSPSLFAYNASLILLKARALYSKETVADLLDPALHAKKKSVERHHLFPKGYLAKLGISGTRATNQIANYAYVEWSDNVKISDQAPADYVPQLEERFSAAELEKMYYYHALPRNWPQMKYETFLERRRELMAAIIREGYDRLTSGEQIDVRSEEFNLDSLMEIGESETVEFKSTLRINMHTGEPDKRMEHAVLRTLAGFLNTNGGTLITGVADDGAALGIEVDKFPNEDKMSLHLANIVKSRMGPHAMTLIHPHFEEYEDEKVFVVRCPSAPVPVFVKDNNDERFYVRTGPSSTELTASQTQEYIKSRFN